MTESLHEIERDIITLINVALQFSRTERNRAHSDNLIFDAQDLYHEHEDKFEPIFKRYFLTAIAFYNHIHNHIQSHS